MFIIPFFPALFANRFLAYSTPHSWCSAPLYSLTYSLTSIQFSSHLLSVTHSTVCPGLHSQTDLHVGTLVCLHTCSARILHDNFYTFWWPMCDAICQSLHTKETHLAFTRLEGAFSHVARSLTWFSIPVKADAVVEKRYPKINLKIMSPLIFVPVFLPLWLSNILLGNKYHDTVLSMNNPIHCPAKNPKVPPVCADTCRVIAAISIVSINTIHWLDVICMGMGFRNSFTLFLPFHMPLDGQSLTESNSISNKKHNLFLIFPSCALHVVCLHWPRQFLLRVCLTKPPLLNLFLAPLENLTNGKSSSDWEVLSVRTPVPASVHQ